MRNMNGGNKAAQKLLFVCSSFTCIYFPGILILLKINGTLYNVGSYKFIPILLILMFAEVIKLIFSFLQTEPVLITKIETKTSKSKRSWTKYIKEGFKFLITSIILSIIYYFLIVMFGAPVFNQHEETTMLTIILTCLTFVPASLHLGVNTAVNILTGRETQKDNIFINAANIVIKTTLLGTWTGAIVIPLDWDRPWQVWPIPCVTGALLGYTIAHFIILFKTLPTLKQSKNF
ncbi:phosphatidylinositol-glycan biosynthesis class F protein-like [Vespa mandarinia]|uniref:phosphatidylinositol-glycan biosynthesis class F protein-like n=1 Tax=Vespa mandarinia TaxID=7446 RepID=UPI0016100A96|nr:phosphatidylinositol-glycan biosynthesis class F protein-like [Vespa mandarinia]XP_035731957.1 phosphatidylinositol-glycan biosynthesis class F protein-like [Vespa mandarinia]XP_047349228.1 phosphatidylinositol-glycan biosynthesis class F protein [Vespa velutina]